MENKLAKITAVLMVLGLVAAGPVAYAESKGDTSENGKGYKHGEGKEFMKDLNLTPEQKEKLKAQREAKKENSKVAREQLKAKMQALHEAIGKPGAKFADVSGLVNEVNVLKSQMFTQRIEGLLTMKEILTPEQFAKMQAKHQEWMNKKHANKGKNQGDSKGDQPETEKA